MTKLAIQASQKKFRNLQKFEIAKIYIVEYVDITVKVKHNVRLHAKTGTCKHGQERLIVVIENLVPF